MTKEPQQPKECECRKLEGGKVIPLEYMPAHSHTKYCPHNPSREDAGCSHDWRFDGDDPYTVCSKCGERRDARTGKPLHLKVGGKFDYQAYKSTKPKQDPQPSLEFPFVMDSVQAPGTTPVLFVRTSEKDAYGDELLTLAGKEDILSWHTARLESLREELKITPDESRSEDTKDVFIEFNSHIDRVFDRAIYKEKG